MSERYAERLNAALGPLALTLAPAAPEELAFLHEVYLGTRLPELSVTDWDEPRKRAFLLDQAERQHEHYTRHYVGAELLVIRLHGERIGRVYLFRGGKDLRLMDIALLPDFRARGLGTALVREIMALARADDCQITLHVEPYNPARRLYERFGFRLIEDRGVYHFLGWNADADAPLLA
jgi:ribosomal protein S18 acetylase RimI-like enzyme